MLQFKQFLNLRNHCVTPVTSHDLTGKGRTFLVVKIFHNKFMIIWYDDAAIVVWPIQLFSLTSGVSYIYISQMKGSSSLYSP